MARTKHGTPRVTETRYGWDVDYRGMTVSIKRDANGRYSYPADDSGWALDSPTLDGAVAGVVESVDIHRSYR